jgi:anti-sigma factor RsiW
MRVRNVVELTCKEVVELVTEYLSRALEAEDQARLEQHLLTCAPCTAYLEQVRKTVALAGGLAQRAPAGAEPDLVALFRRWKQK